LLSTAAVIRFEAMAVRLSVRHPQSAAGDAGEVSYELDQARIAIGRSAGADVRLPHLSVSESHATLEQAPGGYSVRDEGSTNGTRVNGVALVPQRARALKEGDQIEIGTFVLGFSYSASLGRPLSTERTASLARRMLREMLGREHSAASPPFVRIDQGPDRGTVVELSDPPSKLRVGRGEEADLVLSDPDVSRLHLELARDQDGTLARDLDSKNGLEVNGKRLRERRLRHGDAIGLGNTRLVYQDPAEEALRALDGQRDVTITRTLPHAQMEAELEPAPAPVAAPPKPAPRQTQLTDLLVYALALAVLGASLMGLAWLFGS
jgi:pSer/pThr/pTyr-binding forkhead associated (FHA) protein